MATKDVYEELADMLVTAPTGGPGMKTPELMEILRLTYTPREARVAVQVGFEGAKLDEISEKTGIEKGKLKRILDTMAEKCTMWIDPGKEDPTYRAGGIAGCGISETLWGGIRFPFSVQLGKLWNKYKYTWAKEGIAQTGPVFPIWPGSATLPDDALPSENIAEHLKRCDYWAVSTCPCKLWHWLDEPGHHCTHMLETCFVLNDLGRFCVEHNMARELTCDEAIELLRKTNEDGLVHMGAPTAVLCNCDNDCCSVILSHLLYGRNSLRRSDFVPEIDEETCNACKICAERCPMGAIEVDGFAAIDRNLCIGCGVCISGCPPKAMRLMRRPEAERLGPMIPLAPVGEE